MLYKFGEYELDTDRHEFRVGGQLRDLEPQVFHLIRHLVENHDRLVSRDELIAIVWKGRIVSESTIDARIHAARKAVGDDGRRQTRIKTVPRLGYRFIADVEVVRDNDSTAAGNDGASDNPLSLTDRPSIAVLPFANISDDPGQDYFADGIAEDVITALARFRSLFVIARTSSFTYKSLTRNELNDFRFLPTCGSGVERWRGRAMPRRWRWLLRSPWPGGGCG
jgi:DNA-binding winged helix-turn-helix (wHTH) protein